MRDDERRESTIALAAAQHQENEIGRRKRGDGFVKLGLQSNGLDRTGGPEQFAGILAKIIRAAEEAGFDRIGVADYIWQHPIMGGPEANEPERYAGVPGHQHRAGQALRDGRLGTPTGLTIGAYGQKVTPQRRPFRPDSPTVR